MEGLASTRQGQDGRVILVDSHTHRVYSYRIQPDGGLAYKQHEYHLHVPDTADDSRADGLRVDRDGRLYVATRRGSKCAIKPVA